MSVYVYVHAYATLDEVQLRNECLAAGLSTVTDVQREGDAGEHVDVVTSTTLSAPDKTTLDNTVAAHVASAKSLAITTGSSAGNYLINSGFEVDQRARSGSSLSDDSYAVDRWYILTQSNPSTMTRSAITSTITGSLGNSVQLTQSNVTAQRIGMAQIIEGIPSQVLRGQQVTLQAQIAPPDGNIRFAVLGWTGTRDTVTSDVVNNWTSTTYTPGNFFIASTSVVATGLVPQGVGLFLVSITGTPGTTVNNLIVFFWMENALAQSTSFRVFQPALYASPAALPYAPPDVASEISRCQRYCLGLNGPALGVAQNTNNMYNRGALLFPTTMRATPTLQSGTFGVNSGSAGTVALSATSAEGTGFTNSANNWTANALVTITAVLDAEL